MLKRNSSEPNRIGQIAQNNLRENIQSAKPSMAVDYGLRGALAPIREQNELPRSADPRDSTAYKYGNQAYRVRNEAKGYRNDEKENAIRLPKINQSNDRGSQLQKQGAAILAAGKYVSNRPDSKNDALNNIYGRVNNSHLSKPPLVGGGNIHSRQYVNQQDRSNLLGGGPSHNYRQRYQL